MNLKHFHPKLFFSRRQEATLPILMLIMLVNALSYGTIIPLLYPYAARFGITAVSLGFLFASFSLFQFLATPIIGRLSDRYGRRPMLLISLFGTSVSLALFAMANSVPILFFARILDGITGGNMSVAQAVIADKTPPQDRAKQFGLLGASFGFGFMFGPALGGVLSQFGLSAPFWCASALALFGTILGYLLLPETKNADSKSAATQKLIDIKKLITALIDPASGLLLSIMFIAAISTNIFILGFQSTTVDILKMTPTQIGLIFTVFGLANVIMQSVGIRFMLAKIKAPKLLRIILLASVILIFALGFAHTIPRFLAVLGLFMLVPPAAPIISGLISTNAKGEDQGGVLGLSQSYVSLGQIVGPVLAGLVLKFYIPGVFWLAALVMLLGMIMSLKVQERPEHLTDI